MTVIIISQQWSLIITFQLNILGNLNLSCLEGISKQRYFWKRKKWKHWKSSFRIKAGTHKGLAGGQYIAEQTTHFNSNQRRRKFGWNKQILRTDNTGRTWCYTTGWSNTGCRDLQTSQRSTVFTKHSTF